MQARPTLSESTSANICRPASPPEHIGKMRASRQFPKFLFAPARELFVAMTERGWFGGRGLERHVVLCGFPRSGSTLLQLMIEACVADVQAFGRERRALEIAKSALCSKSYMLTKRPSDIFLIDELERFYAHRQADVRFVVTIRDPRAVLTSKHAKISPREYYVPAERMRAMYDHWKWARSLKTATVVRYEDLVTYPDIVERALTRFLGWQVVRPFSEYEQSVPNGFDTAALNGLRSLDRGGIDRWREPQHRERLTRLLNEEMPELPDMLIEMGYEWDYEWVYEYLGSAITTRAHTPAVAAQRLSSEPVQTVTAVHGKELPVGDAARN